MPDQVPIVLDEFGERVASPYKARFVTEPIVAPLAQMELIDEGVRTMMRWVQSRAPACLPEEWSTEDPLRTQTLALFPHDGHADDGRLLTDNELLVELAGRKCYNSFGAKAGRKSNAEYIAHMQSGEVPHASVLYHAKLSFFIAGVSRRVSHELIRNYVGADRDEEGSPSQESTRFVEHAGFYIIPPKYLADQGDPAGQSALRADFENACHANYRGYRDMVATEINRYKNAHGGEAPRGMDYKRILEAASALLMHTVETSWIWTTNPMAIAKMARERDTDGGRCRISALHAHLESDCRRARAQPLSTALDAARFGVAGLGHHHHPPARRARRHPRVYGLERPLVDGGVVSISG